MSSQYHDAPPRFSLPPPPVTNTPLEFMPTHDLSFWDSDVTPGCTVSLDAAVSFKDGYPSLRIDLPAGLPAGTVVKVGTTGAAGKGQPRIPFNWDLQRFSFALRSTNAAIMQTGGMIYLGNSDYSSFWSGFLNALHYGGSAATDTVMFVDNAWWVPKLATPLDCEGTPTAQNLSRGKFTVQLTAATTQPETIWLGMLAALPKRKLPTVILSFDDGYASWDTYLMERLKYYDLPASFAIVTSLLGKSDYMSAERMKARFDDPSRLFDFTLHQSVHDNVAVQGSAQYVTALQVGRDQMRAAGIGGDGPSHHAWVESLWTNTAIDAMRAAGFLSARGAGYTAERGFDQVFFSGNDKDAYILNTSMVNLTNDASFAQVQAAIQTAVDDGSFVFVNGHDIVRTPASDYQTSYAVIDELLAWLAGQVAAGALQVVSHSRWFADTTGRVTDRR
ncbi:polysaccharide deacetylase family protein [Janthinobacterium rivuli]|uniref:polysaccharide deacetylase family protein n=1 Tax=Janthinobacterium rivuli TaxID=2751478 RepID=UPI00383AF7CF